MSLSLCPESWLQKEKKGEQASHSIIHLFQLLRILNFLQQKIVQTNQLTSDPIFINRIYYVN